MEPTGGCWSDSPAEQRRGSSLPKHYSTYNQRVHFSPVWFPDGSYTVNTHVMDIWTPAGMLAMNLTDDVTISGSLYDDWHIAPGNP